VALIEPDARQLVEAHQAGDRQAFEEIARLAYPSLYGHARRKLGDHHAAEDAVQDTLVRAYRALPRFDGDFRLHAWLHRILANVCSDEGSRRCRETDAVERVGSLAVNPVPDPADLTVTASVRSSVVGALTELPDRYREAVFLRYLEDLSYRDVADVIGVTEENARTRVSRGRAVLQRVVGRGLGALVFVFPSLRRHQATAPTDAGSGAISSTALAEQATQLAASSGAGPMTTLSAQITSQVVHAAPAVTRLVELSASVGGTRASVVANVVGAIAAVSMPVAAYTVVDDRPRVESKEVATADVDAETEGAEPIHAPDSGSLPTPGDPGTTLAGAIGGSTTTSILVSPIAPNVEPLAAPTRKPILPITPPAPPSEWAETPPGDEAEPAAPGDRRGSIVSDALSVTVDGPDLELNGPIGFAVAEGDTEPAEGRTGTLSGDLEIDDPSEERTERRVTGRLKLLIGGNEHVLRLEGWLVEMETSAGRATWRFLGSYRLSGSSGLGLDDRGHAAWVITVTEEATPGDAAPASSVLRLSLGHQPEPVEGDAP